MNSEQFVVTMIDGKHTRSSTEEWGNRGCPK